MRSLLAIVAASLVGVAGISVAVSAPSADSTRSRIRVLEQRVIDANRAIPAARQAEQQAMRRLAASEQRLEQIRAQLSRRTASHRAGQAVLAGRLRDIYRAGEQDPLVTALLSAGGLAALASERAGAERIAQCESGGNPRSIGGGGQFRGKYQFMQSTWEAMGGTGDPAAASEAEQDYRAAVLFVKWGPGQWPVCAAFAR